MKTDDLLKMQRDLRNGVLSANSGLDVASRKIGLRYLLRVTNAHSVGGGTLYTHRERTYHPTICFSPEAESKKNGVMALPWEVNHPTFTNVLRSDVPLILENVANDLNVDSWRDVFLRNEVKKLVAYRIPLSGGEMGLVTLHKKTLRSPWSSDSLHKMTTFVNHGLSIIMRTAMQTCRSEALMRFQFERQLGEQELMVAVLASRGWQDKMIANYLGKSVKTVRNQLHAVREKLDLSNRVQLANALRMRGFL